MRCPDEKSQRKYLETVLNDIRVFKTAKRDFTLIGFDIGGGTPTALDESAFSFLMDIYAEGIANLPLSDDFELSIEATFTTISPKKLELIAKSGIRWISFGVQSTNANVLSKNNRYTDDA